MRLWGLEKKMVLIIILSLINSSGIAQNHRQFSNWLIGDFSINDKKMDGSIMTIETHFVNLSNIDSNDYWIVEEILFDKVKSSRLFHIALLDSGYVGVDIYKLKPQNPIQVITSIKQIKLENYQKINVSQLVLFYNRAARGFEIKNTTSQLFYLNKYVLKLNCCNDFSDFYFQLLKKKQELVFIKKAN